MVYSIVNRILYRGFHQSLTGKKTITKPDGKVIKGDWLFGCLSVVPMQTPPGAAPQLPILCLSEPDRRNGRVGEYSICPCTLSLFSGTWMDTDWDYVSKPVQREWLSQKKTSADWRGIPVFEGDILWHKVGKTFFVVTYDLLHGFKLEEVATGDTSMTWYFGLMQKKGTLLDSAKRVSSRQAGKISQGTKCGGASRPNQILKTKEDPVLGPLLL